MNLLEKKEMKKLTKNIKNAYSENWVGFHNQGFTLSANPNNC